jgi:putative membrane protein
MARSVATNGQTRRSIRCGNAAARAPWSRGCSTRSAIITASRSPPGGRNPRRTNVVVEWIIRIVINFVALIVAAKIVPDISLKIGPFGVEWLKVAAIALVFALVNSYIKPIVKALSFPITLLTLGLVAFLINAALFLLVAWIADQLFPGILKVGGFPPTLNGNAILAAILGSIVISIVSTILGMISFGRRLVIGG